MEDKLREEFLSKVRGQIEHWKNEEIDNDLKFDKLAESFLDILDSEYIMAPIDDDGKVLPIISGSLKSRYLGEAETSSDDADEFVEHLKEVKEYWRGQVVSDKDGYKLDGFMFSLLVALDGGAVMPPYYLASKKETEIDIAGFLHELLHKKR